MASCSIDMTDNTAVSNYTADSRTAGRTDRREPERKEHNKAAADIGGLVYTLFHPRVEIIDKTPAVDARPF